MTLRSSSELADDEGRVFLAYAPPRTLMVMGRRDPRNGAMCVEIYLEAAGSALAWSGRTFRAHHRTGSRALARCRRALDS
jgi:hypothetical protein